MYITELQAISPQNSYTNNSIEPATIHTGNKYAAIEPSYTGIIPPNQLRRMGKSLRMGIGAAMPIVTKYPEIQGIIIGSSDGGLEDCIKFLNQIVLFNEGTLSPTGFVQSTPNSVAGTLASMSMNTGHNCTHVHRGHAFENALIDAIILHEIKGLHTILVGNSEEISEFNYNIEAQGNWFKTEETNSHTLLQSNTPGTVCGESSCMFLLQSHALDYYAKLCDIDIFSFPSPQDIHIRIEKFLKRNHIAQNNISNMYLGYNGDCRTDILYKAVENKCAPTTNIYTFKNLVGEHPTAIAYAVYKAALHLHHTHTLHTPHYSLIYNHYKNEQHSLILLMR